MPRLTVAQALVRFLAVQDVERDGVRAALLRGLLRASSAMATSPGSGRRSRAARRRTCRLLPGPQRAGDGAHRRRLRAAAQPPRDLRLHDVGRARRDQHGHRRRRWPRSIAFRCCCCPATPSPPGCRTRCSSSSRSPTTPTVSVNDCLAAGVAVLRPHPATRAADPGGAGGDARADRPGRDGRGHAGPARGRADRGVRRPGDVLGAARLDRYRQPPGARGRGARRGADHAARGGR